MAHITDLAGSPGRIRLAGGGEPRRHRRLGDAVGQLAARRRGRRSAGFHGDSNGHCDGWNSAVTAPFYQRVEIKSDGTFKGRGLLESTSAEGTFLFTGRFSGAGSAEGVGRVLFTFVNGNSRYKCDTGDVSWQVRTSLNRFDRSRPAAGRSYFGSTGQRLPMVLRVSPDGRPIEQQAGMWNAKKNLAGVGRATSSPVDVRDKAGKRADSCDSGPVRWGVRL